MSNDYEADLITLLDDDGMEHEFEIIDEIENDDGHFIALLPTFTESGDLSSEPDTYYIFEVVDEDGEELLTEVEDDDLLNKLSEIFETRFEESFYEEDEEAEDEE
ncbi:MAG: DUF1292 domain-containing protein [Clostridia bacterium]|nr:DUF1292 domain-containing protein [Clostridia bacterium]